MWIETSFDTEENNLKDHDDATALVSLQQLIIQKPELFRSLDAPSNLALEILVSLPANTPRNYEFLGYALNDGSDDSHYYFLKTVAVRESRRLTPNYFERERRHVIERISKELNGKEEFFITELLKDSLWIINNSSFLKDVDAFPYYMVTEVVNNGLDAKLVQILARYTRAVVNVDFMKKQRAYDIVNLYADTQRLRGTFTRYDSERAPILEVLAALKAEYRRKTITEDRSAGLVWKTVDITSGEEN